jgi:PBP1b-binding outer membrane lipoprotein LpoB
MKKTKIYIGLFAVLLLAVTGCSAEKIEVTETPMNTPYSLGPTTPPSVEAPTTNPPN